MTELVFAIPKMPPDNAPVNRRSFKEVMRELALVHPHLLKGDGSLNANAIARDCGGYPSQPTISRLLTNRNQVPSTATARAMGARYGVPTAYIRGEIAHPSGSDDLDLPYPVVLIVRRLMALPFEARQQVGALIATLEELQGREEQKQNVIVFDPIAGKKPKRR